MNKFQRLCFPKLKIVNNLCFFSKANKMNCNCKVSIGFGQLTSIHPFFDPNEWGMNNECSSLWRSELTTSLSSGFLNHQITRFGNKAQC